MIFLDQDASPSPCGDCGRHRRGPRTFRAREDLAWSCAYPEFRRSCRNARTKRWVSVATPLKRCNRFNATRSPVSRARAEALTRAGICPGLSFTVVAADFRFRRGVQERKTSTNRSIQPRRAAPCDHLPRARCVEEMTVYVVMSPAPRSSARNDRNRLWQADTSSGGTWGELRRFLAHLSIRTMGRKARTRNSSSRMISGSRSLIQR